MAINTGILNVGSVGGSTVDSASLDTRRMYNFSDRVADLAPEESPFFVYLSKVAKVPTDDPTFRFLENRTKASWTDRSFLLKGTCLFPAAGSSVSCTIDTSGGASVDWLVKGMVIAVGGFDSSTLAPETIIARVESGPIDNGSDTTFTSKTISKHSSAASTTLTNTQCTVIGTSFAEGSGSPDVWSEGLDDDYGYTQIFKTAAEMSNTSIATRYRGYENEWQRIWNLKLREHKVDIERAMLFGQRASVSSINYSEGIIGHIVKNATPVGGTTALSYSSGAPYMRSAAATEFTYDMLLGDFEVVYDPARGGSSNKLALASLPVITLFNKLGGQFLDYTLNATNINNVARYNIAEKQGSFGHSIMEINTVHGTMSLVKEPLFRGFADSYLCLCDMSNIAYRPLVGNGLNRDTHITTNVQQADEDLRKDLILTEAGLEVALPESHFLINLEGAT